MSRDKKLWEALGARDPYFAVATIDKFLKTNLDEKAIDEFFETGRDYVDRIWSDFDSALGVHPHPKRALDYGCGVGRVLVALAEKCESVVGVDISETMIAEARKNCEIRGITNFELVEPQEFFRRSQKFDFIHSVVVLQHIDPKSGMQIISDMNRMLEQNGVGMLHVTYVDRASSFQKIKGRAYGRFPFLLTIVNKIRGGETRHWMPMHVYDLNAVFKLLQENGCNNVAVRFSDHGLLGALIFFQKSGAVKY